MKEIRAKQKVPVFLVLNLKLQPRDSIAMASEQFMGCKMLFTLP
jgi:hypothetical protein